MDVKAATAHRSDPVDYEYETRDAIIYALGVGATTKDDLQYVYEGAAGFMPLPSFIVSPGLLANNILDWPGIEFDLTRILHGEQYIELYEPLPPTGSLKSECQVVDILDKGSGALIISNVTTYDKHSGKKIAMQQIGTFQVGSGKFGGARTSVHEKKGVDIPKRAPDTVIEQQTSVDQATLYRMGSGDLNPLHVDPEFATMSGFKQPILHGLCSLGFATRHVLKAYADNDARAFKALKVRFASPVLPGQTLQTIMWDEGDKIVFEVKVKETGKTVVSNAYMELHGKRGKGKAKM